MASCGNLIQTFGWQVKMLANHHLLQPIKGKKSYKCFTYIIKLHIYFNSYCLILHIFFMLQVIKVLDFTKLTSVIFVNFSLDVCHVISLGLKWYI